MYSRGVRRAAALLALPLAAGCYHAPRTLTEAGLDNPDRVLADAPLYWENVGTPPAPHTPRPRIAVAEFSVEFVTDKLTGFFGSRPMFATEAFSITGRCVELLGFGRLQARFDDQTKSRIPGVLYGQFVDQLKSQGYDVIATPELAGTPAYQKFEHVEPQDAYVTDYFNITGGDTGRARSIEVFSAAGLKTIDEGQKGLAAIQADLMEEARADAVLRVRIRVGIDRERAALQQDSLVRVVWHEQDGVREGELRCIRSIVTDDKVVARTTWRPIQGDVDVVDASLFAAGITRAFPAFANMALYRLNCDPEQGQPLATLPTWFAAHTSRALAAGRHARPSPVPAPEPASIGRGILSHRDRTAEEP